MSRKMKSGEYQTEVNVSRWLSGVYTLSLIFTDEQMITQKVAAEK